MAYEATKICHGRDAADKARNASRRLFNQEGGQDIEAIPSYSMTSDDLGGGIEAYILFHDTNLCKTRSEARRLISQGGAYVNGRRISSIDVKVGPDDVQDRTIMLRAGKKKYLRVHIQDY